MDLLVQAASKKLNLQAACRTTAMGIMPHASVERAVNLALGMDIPFFPQLPNVNFYEDMYVQTSQHFPGIVLDPTAEKISFDTTRFTEELEEYSRGMADPGLFALNPGYSVAYHRFLEQDLAKYPAIRGQVTGPVSFGFRVTDENSKPIIYNDEVRVLLFDFIQRRAVADGHRQSGRCSEVLGTVSDPKCHCRRPGRRMLGRRVVQRNIDAGAVPGV